MVLPLAAVEEGAGPMLVEGVPLLLGPAGVATPVTGELVEAGAPPTAEELPLKGAPPVEVPGDPLPVVPLVTGARPFDPVVVEL